VPVRDQLPQCLVFAESVHTGGWTGDATLIQRNDLRNLGRGCNSRRLHFFVHMRQLTTDRGSMRLTPLGIAPARSRLHNPSSPLPPSRGEAASSNPAIPSGVTSFLDTRDLQQDATACDHLRSPSATKNATRALPDDPDLAAVVTAWPSLPEAVRAGIVAMVKPSAPDQGPCDRSPDGWETAVGRRLLGPSADSGRRRDRHQTPGAPP
jgi:hypothetical protein